jgi:uncharacterized protein YutE (UPF0331/DUF86 family)
MARATAPASSAPAVTRTSWVTKEIRDGLHVLDRYRQVSLEEFRARTAAVDAAKYRLLIALEAAVSMCHHLAMRLAGRAPESYADCVSALAEFGFIPTDRAERLGRMAHCRSLFLHLEERVVCG